MNKFILIFGLMIVLGSLMTFAWTPTSDIDLRNYYQIVNGTNISATSFYQDGNAVLDNTSTINNANYSTYANSSSYLGDYSSSDFILSSNEVNLNVNHSNSTDYWGIYNLASDLNYGILLYYINITGRPTHLSDLIDNLGNRGYTSLSNFTNDIDLINSSYGNDTYILQSEESNLNVNRSGYWDNLNTPADINAGDITDDGTYRLQSWDNFTGIPHATPSNGDITHFSYADEIYDFVIALGYITTDTNASTACTGAEVLYGNGTCGVPPGGSYTAGNGISLVGSEFSVAGNTALTQDSDGLSVTADAIGDTQLEYNTGQLLTTAADVTHDNVTASTQMTTETLLFEGNTTDISITANSTSLILSAGNNKYILNIG